MIDGFMDNLPDRSRGLDLPHLAKFYYDCAESPVWLKINNKVRVQTALLIVLYLFGIIYDGAAEEAAHE